jgi:hypothetical protein
LGADSAKRLEMTGNQGTDIGQLTKILTIAIVAVLILVVAVGILFVSKMFVGNDEILDTFESSYGEYYNSVVSPTPGQQTTTGSSAGISQTGSVQTGNMAADTGISDSVNVVESFIPDDPFFKQFEFETDAVPEDSVRREYYQALYKTSKSLDYDSMSVVVSVSKGPLVVCYEVSNFAAEADDGSGNPYYSFMNIAVINTETNETVATGGYNRQNPSEEEQYFKVPMVGEFRIDAYGKGLDVDLTVLSGTVPENPNSFSVIPDANDVYSQLTSRSSALYEDIDYEEEW